MDGSISPCPSIGGTCWPAVPESKVELILMPRHSFFQDHCVCFRSHRLVHGCTPSWHGCFGIECGLIHATFSQKCLILHDLLAPRLLLDIPSASSPHTPLSFPVNSIVSIVAISGLWVNAPASPSSAHHHSCQLSLDHFKRNCIIAGETLC
jgi:hypothetical protein